MSDGESLLDVDGLALYLHVSASWVYKAVARGAIPVQRVGRIVRFRRSAIDAWLAAQGGGNGVHV